MGKAFEEIQFERSEAGLRQLFIRMLDERKLPDAQLTQLSKFIKSASQNYATFSALIQPTTKAEVFSPEGVHRLLEKQMPMKLVSAAGTRRDTLSFRLVQNSSGNQHLLDLVGKLEKMWGIQRESLLILNAYPNGIYIPIGLNSLEAGPRMDVLKLAFSSLASEFKTLLVVSQPHFLRVLLKQKWVTPEHLKKLHFIIGGCWNPRHFFKEAARTHSVQEEALEARALALYGMAEAGIGIGVQTASNSRLRCSPFGEDLRNRCHVKSGAVPMIFDLDANRYFLEIVNSELLITTISDSSGVPLLRYRTGDHGMWLKEDKGVLRFALSGRSLSSDPNGCHPDDIEELLAESPELTTILTGRYRILSNKVFFELQGKSPKSPTTEQQLKTDLEQKFSTRFKNAPTVHLCLEGTDVFSNPVDFLRKPSPDANAA